MIRPSALQIAERCGLAPRLAEQYPSQGEAAAKGTAIHEDIAAWLRGEKDAPATPEGKALAGQWERPDCALLIERKVHLEDPESGELLTEGTADLAYVEGDVCVVVDWKTGKPENVAPSCDNLQLLAYGIGLALELGASKVQVGIGFLNGGVTWDTGPVLPEGEWWPIIDRLRAACQRPAAPTTGPHCDHCYQRLHCPSWCLPAYEGETALAPFVAEDGLSLATIERGYGAYKALKDILDVVKGRLDAFLAINGGEVPCGEGYVLRQEPRTGRRTAAVDELEAAGLGQYVRQGAPYMVLARRKAGKR